MGLERWGCTETETAYKRDQFIGAVRSLYTKKAQGRGGASPYSTVEGDGQKRGLLTSRGQQWSSGTSLNFYNGLRDPVRGRGSRAKLAPKANDSHKISFQIPSPWSGGGEGVWLAGAGIGFPCPIATFKRRSLWDLVEKWRVFSPSLLGPKMQWWARSGVSPLCHISSVQVQSSLQRTLCPPHSVPSSRCPGSFQL